MNRCSKIIIGTANFEKKYGIYPRRKNFKNSELIRIISNARRNSVEKIDTAFSYYTDDKLKKLHLRDWKITTKIPIIKSNKNIKKFIFNNVEKSIKKLKITRFDTILIHDTSQLFSNKGNEILESFESLKASGLTDKIGYSVYYPDELRNLIKIFKPDTVQIPYSIADRRFEKNNFLKKIKNLGIKVEARSIFLKGLLLLSSLNRPFYFNKWKKELSMWDIYIHNNQLDRIQVCLDFINSNKEIDNFIIGFDSLDQFNEILEKNKTKKTKNFYNFKFLDEKILIPSNWKI